MNKPSISFREDRLTVRALVGGFLYFEGFIVLAVGLALSCTYWPPIEWNGQARNPVGMVGAVIMLIALTYLVAVGGILFTIHLLYPNREGKFTPDPRWARLRRYQALRRKGDIIFDQDIVSVESAREAYEIRKIMRD